MSIAGATHPRLAPRAQPLALLFAALVAVDLFFVALHLVHVQTDWLPGVNFSIERDIGYAERFQYLQMLSLAAGLSWLATRWREWTLAAWAGLFGYLVFDDALQLHERIGRRIAAYLDFPDALGLQAKDFGEMSAALLVGMVLLPPLIAGYFRAAPRTRAVARDLTVLLAALLTFGIGIDMLHSAAADTVLNTPIALVEDGGEMLVMSAGLCYLLQWLRAEAPGEVPFRPGRALAMLSRSTTSATPLHRES
jgi:hypothetical protein